MVLLLLRVRFYGPSSVGPRKRNQKKKATPTALRSAVRQGLVPKARKPFALFTQAQLQHGPRANVSFAEIGRKWRALPAEEKAIWQQRSVSEHQEQRAAVSCMGLKVRWFEPVVPVARVSPESPGAAFSDNAHAVTYGDYVVPPGSASLGEGTFGKVLVVRHVTSGRRFALKAFKHEQEASGDIERELKVYAALAGRPRGEPGSGAFLEAQTSCRSGPLTWLVLSLGGESLAKALRTRRFCHEEVQAVALQAAQGLHHLHTVGFLHLDFKPGNCLWAAAARHLQIIDFGCAVPHPLLDDDYDDSACTGPYRPPELEHGARKPLLLPAVDVWSLGCTVFEAASGKVLFQDRRMSRTYCRATRGDRTAHVEFLPWWVRAPRPWRAVVRQLCAPQPAERPQLVHSLLGVAWLHKLAPRDTRGPLL